MAQTWSDLLFAHWPVPAEQLRPLVPQALELDLYEGQAWVAVVPFRMRGVRSRGTPPLPGLSSFPELNLRTYVRGVADRDPHPGVFFFSLDAARMAAVAIARTLFHLPYFRAEMSCTPTPGADPGIRYLSRRTHAGVPDAEFIGEYGPTGPPAPVPTGSLEHFLLERYCLYAVQPQPGSTDRVWCGEIHHAPWPIQSAFAHIEVNTIATSMGIQLPDRKPLLHFARELKVVVWPPRRVQ